MANTTGALVPLDEPLLYVNTASAQKTLCVLEALVKVGLPDVVEFFRSDFDALVDFESSSIRQIASKASQVRLAVLKCAAYRIKAESPYTSCRY